MGLTLNMNFFHAWNHALLSVPFSLITSAAEEKYKESCAHIPITIQRQKAVQDQSHATDVITYIYYVYY